MFNFEALIPYSNLSCHALGMYLVLNIDIFCEAYFDSDENQI